MSVTIMMRLLLLLLGALIFVGGEPVFVDRDSPETTTTTRDVLLITYSSCTTFTDATRLAIAPVTEMASVIMSDEVLATISPMTAYTTSTSDWFKSTISTFPIRVFNPSDISPIKLAKNSAMHQPYECLTATSSVDYRQACQTGADYRMEDDRSITCGKLNPCCYGCFPYNKICVGNCPRDFFLRCNNGVDYFDGGVSSIDPLYTEPYPTMAFSDWTKMSTTSSYPMQPSATPTANPAGPAADFPAATPTESAEKDGGEKLSGLTGWTASLVVVIAGILVLLW